MKNIVKRLMKLSEEKFVWIFSSFWLISNLTTYIITKDNFFIIISTYLFLLIIGLIVEYCDIPTELGFSYEIDMLIKTNLEWITFETFNRDYCLNKNLEKPLIVTEKDINEIGVTLFENNGYVSMEIFSNIKHISLTLIHGVLKCFGNYKILNIEEGDIKTGTIFVNTDLPIVVYGEPLGHITKQMINDYQNALKS